MKQYKELVEAALREINETADWKWTAKYTTKQIRLTNDYIKGQHEKDCFTIELEQGDGGAVKVTDCLGDSAGYFLVGNKFYEDGSREECLTMAVRSAQRYFSNRY